MYQLLLLIIYFAFISLGLPDSLLGSAWPSMYQNLHVPVSYAGMISMIIAFGTIISSLQSDRLTRKLGTGKVTMISVAMTALALFGFSFSSSFWMLCLWAIPYGLGAGSVDASLNNYVALHYASRHMSWLHCMWGVGASLGPTIMGYALTGNLGWNGGYRIVGILQIALTAVLFFSLPLWKGREVAGDTKPQEVDDIQDIDSKESHSDHVLSLKEIIRISGAKEVMLAFFFYCGIEQTTGLWGTSYLVMNIGITPAQAATYASTFFIGVTVGRAVSGFLTMAISDKNMIRLGQTLGILGTLFFFLPMGRLFAPIGLIIIGVGCAPIYPCIIHSTPSHFGKEKSQAIIGVQMASAYVGTCLMPPLFGMIAQHITIKLFPIFLLILFGGMIAMHEALVKKTK